MARAGLKLVAIAAVALILALFAVFWLRWLGSHQTFAPPSHAWFQSKFWWIYQPTPEEICQGPELPLPSTQWIVAVPVQREAENWYVPCARKLPLEKYLQQTSHTEFLLRVQAHDTWSLDNLTEIVSHFEHGRRFAVQSDSQKVMIYLRKKAPQWLFAADASSLLRLKFFSSFGIESALDFWPDFVISSPLHDDGLDSRVVNELERRQKRILLEWQDGVLDPAFPVDGILTNRPKAAEQKFGPRH